MPTPDFQRARQPEQKAARREAILAAAAELFDTDGPNGTGLNAIAAKAGFTKSNVYRYFESREEVLLSLFLDEIAAITEAMEKRFAASPVGDLDGLATLVTTECLARPRFCQLLSILSWVLEQNVSEEVIVAFKRGGMPFGMRLATALNRVLPDLSLEQCGTTWGLLSLLLAAMWPVTHPSESAARVYARAEFAALKPDPERDMRRAVLVVLRGTVAGAT